MVALFRSRGFTLIEMLVVLVIAGLFVALVSTIARPDEKGLLAIETERLAQLFDVAVTESRMTGKTIGWTAEASGYRFWRLREKQAWTPIGEHEALHARTLPEGMMISAVRVESMPAQAAFRLEFSAYGPALSFVVQMSMGAQHFAILGSPVGDVRVSEGGTGAETAQR